MKAVRASGAGLHWVHWLIVFLSAAVTITAYFITSAQIADKVETRFNREADRVVDLVVDRLQRYEDALWSGTGLMRSHKGDVTRSEWLVFAESLNLEVKYPGINGIGVIEHITPEKLDAYLKKQRAVSPEFSVFPDHEEPDRWPITYIEPSASNSAAIGLDIAHEANRYGAARRARDTGTAQITGPIVLVQDDSKTPGFLFFAPYYADGTQDSIGSRRATFQGMVYAPFIANSLLHGVLAADRRHVAIRLTDITGAEEVLYDEHLPSQPGFDEAPLFRRSAAVKLYGRTWRFDIRANESFREAAGSSQPLTILIAGIVVDVMLLIIFLVLGRGNEKLAGQIDERRRAEAAVRKARDELEEIVAERTAALARSNEDLRHFAYAASHDLRAPMRAVLKLVSWFREDHGSELEREANDLLNRIENRTARLDALLDSLLAFNRIGDAESLVESLTSAEVAQDAFDSLHAPEAFSLELSELPRLMTDRGALTMTFQNLFQNSVRHHDRGGGVIAVSAIDTGGFVEFHVTDDGPGIPLSLAEQAFKPFRTLQPRDQREGSGMGLAIVKRQVEVLGGSVRIESSGRGTTVAFTWPHEWPSRGASKRGDRLTET